MQIRSFWPTLLFLCCAQFSFAEINENTVNAIEAAHIVKNATITEAVALPPLPPPVINNEDPLDFEDQLAHTEDVLTPNMSPQGLPFSLNDAIAFALENQITLQLSELNIDVQKGVVRSAAAPFDYYLQGNAAYIDQRHLQNSFSGLKTNKNGNETLAAFSATKATRPGTSFAITGQVDKVKNPLNKPVINNIGSLSFLVQQPLLRGFLTGLPWMQEKAAQYELYAVYFDDFQAISQNIFNTTTAYWQAVANQYALEIQEESLRRIVKLSRQIEELIKNSELAAQDILQPQAQEVDLERAILEAWQSLYNSVQNLKLVMGDVSVNDFDDIPLYLTDTFELPPLDPIEFQTQFPQYLKHAITYRFDIQASTLRQIEAAYLVKGANNDRLPSLNVFGQVTTPNFEQNDAGKPVLSPWEMHRPQTNWTIGVNLAFPLYNDGPMGFLEQKQAQYSQAVLNTQLLQEQAITALRTALSNQITLMAQLKEADEAVRLNRQLYDNGVIQLQAGLISLFDLLSFESRLTNALLLRIGFRSQYMQNIALLHFLTSTTFNQGDDNNCIEIHDLASFPKFCIDKVAHNPKMEKYLQRIKRIKEDASKTPSTNNPSDEKTNEESK